MSKLPKINPLETTAWFELDTHIEDFLRFSLREEFEKEQKRFD